MRLALRARLPRHCLWNRVSLLALLELMNEVYLDCGRCFIDKSSIYMPSLDKSVMYMARIVLAKDSMYILVIHIYITITWTKDSMYIVVRLNLPHLLSFCLFCGGVVGS